MAKSTLKKIFVTVGAIAVMLPVLTGCGNYKIDRTEILNGEITNVMQHQITQTADIDYEILDYQLIGADVAKTAFDFGVKFNGVASLSNGDTAYASLNYSVPSTEFLDLQKDSPTKKIYDLLEKIVHEYEPQSFSITPVTSLTNVNDAFVKNAPTPFNGYNLTDGMVYNLGEPVFNDKDCTITFDVKTLMDLSKVKSKPGWGLCIGFDATVCYGFGIPITPTKAEGTFTTLDRYVIKVDKETYQAMKADNKKIYDFCVQEINKGNSSQLEAERQITSYVTYDNADLLKELDGMKTIESELNR